MSFHWRYSDGRTSEHFPSQSDAETWMGESWRQLLTEGVEDVTLMEDVRVVYGPMSLRPAT